MQKSTSDLDGLLAALTLRARSMRLTDTDWAARAGVRKETLSRLRKRQTCDFATLRELARIVDAHVTIVATTAVDRSADGHFPAELNREAEDRLLTLAASRDRRLADWAALGPPFFMAGFAVMLASAMANERQPYLALAESLHPGATEPEVFSRWLDRSPLRPSRFLPMLKKRMSHAAES